MSANMPRRGGPGCNSPSIPARSSSLYKTMASGSITVRPWPASTPARVCAGCRSASVRWAALSRSVRAASAAPGWKCDCRCAREMPAMTGAKIRVLLIEDHAIFRQGVRLILEATPDIAVVGEASDGEEGLRLLTRLAGGVDVVITD